MIEWTDEDRKKGYHLNGDPNARKEDFNSLEEYCQRRYGDVWNLCYVIINDKVYRYKLTIDNIRPI